MGSDPTSNPRPTLAVALCGSVGACHMPEAIGYLREQFAESIHVLMSRAAAMFVTETALRVFSGNPVLRDPLEPTGDRSVPHVELSREADFLLVMPATANILAKAAHGIGDDLISTTILCFDERVVFVPNMNESMWHNRIVQDNVRRLVSLRRTVIEPVGGSSVCGGEVSAGAMPRIETIVDYLWTYAARIHDGAVRAPDDSQCSLDGVFR